MLGVSRCANVLCKILYVFFEYITEEILFCKGLCSPTPVVCVSLRVGRNSCCYVLGWVLKKVEVYMVLRTIVLNLFIGVGIETLVLELLSANRESSSKPNLALKF